MAKNKEKKSKKSKKDKVEGEAPVISESKIKLLTQLPFLIPLLYKKKTPPMELTLSIAKKGLVQKMPKVNLLPPEIAMIVKYRRTKFLLMLSGASLALISVMIYLIAGITLTQGQKSLAMINQQVASAQAQTSKYLPYQAYLDGIKTKVAAANQKLGVQLNYQKIVNDLNTALGSGAILTNVGTKLIPATAAPAAGTQAANPAEQCGAVDNPFATQQDVLVACISFSGTVNDRAQIPGMIARLTGVSYLKDVSLVQSGAAGGTAAIPFAGTAAITKAAVLPLTGAISLPTQLPGATAPAAGTTPAGTTPAGTTPAGTTPAGTTPAGKTPLPLPSTGAKK